MKQWMFTALWGLLIFGFVWWVTAPSGDQVCRMEEHAFTDWLHGVSGQPTCQRLIDQVEAHAIDAERHANDLETRVEELESRLN